MPRVPKVDHVRDAFLTEVASARALVQAVASLPKTVNPAVAIGVHPKHERQIVALAFMGVVAGWEEFVERTLVRYLAGATSAGGFSPQPKFGLANSITHAYELLSQETNYDPDKHYLKVTEPKWVWSMADFFFKSHPFGLLKTNADLIRHASSIRNRVAHDSTKSKADFKRTCIYFLQPARGSLSQGYAPGNLLLAPVQRHFGQAQLGRSHFDAYMSLFEDLSRQLVP